MTQKLWAWGIGHWGGSAVLGSPQVEHLPSSGIGNFNSPSPPAPCKSAPCSLQECPMPHAPCPMPNAPCPIS
ncbi:MAG: hypothetical protein KME31_13150 [Tolypothrix carrinoi HA7290-LM1]|nr:hypothetical protein [Tolypothrix carrinoi HA7290-LM1]